MSIYTEEIEPDVCNALKNDINGQVYIIFKKKVGLKGSFAALAIKSPAEAHSIREAVNKGVDLFLGNSKKGL
ncbi:MAG: hypothetical protein JJW03_05160 [Desulfosarcina sp.]|nr:hypothetical protein [Desulfobacterales bacterium]